MAELPSRASDAAFPTWPPGFWRRIQIVPGDGWVGAALEDDIHAFLLRLDHRDGIIVAVAGKALRHPWTACPGAVGKLQADLVGQHLADVVHQDPAPQCTHLIELAVLAAAHAESDAAIRYDMFVADRVEERTTATFAENGRERLAWQVDGMTIAAPAVLAGRDLWKMSAWKAELSPRAFAQARMLRRAIFVSGGRRFRPPVGRFAVEQANGRLGVCYNYSLPQAATSERVADWRIDFSGAGHAPPLAGIDTAAAFAELGR